MREKHDGMEPGPDDDPRARRGGRRRCGECEFATTDAALLGRHVDIVHTAAVRRLADGKTVEMLSCVVCGYETVDGRCLDHHDSYMHSKWHLCFFCDHGCRMREELARHMAAAHPGRTFDCRLCKFKVGGGATASPFSILTRAGSYRISKSA